MTPERRATSIAMATAGGLALLKFSFGLLSGSMAVLASATDSLGDLFVSFINFLAVGKSEDPGDHDHNYGHGKIEGFAALFEGIVVGGSAIVLIVFSVQKIMHFTPINQIDSSIWVMLISLAATFFLIQYLRKVIKQTGSLVIRADELHYRTDLITNGGVLLCIGIIKIFPSLSIIDPIISIIIALYIITSAISIIQEGAHMLMDGSISDNTREEIIRIIETENEKVLGYHCLRTRISGKVTFVDVHVVLDGNMILHEAHDIADSIEKKIMDFIPNSIATIHLDPRDDSGEKNYPI